MGDDNGLTDFPPDIDYFHMADWECTYNRDQWDLLGEEIDQAIAPYDIHEVYTLIKGPAFYAARVPVSFDDGGDIEEEEIMLFPSIEAARAALAKAQPPHGGRG